jgi:hypothetical protein
MELELHAGALLMCAALPDLHLVIDAVEVWLQELPFCGVQSARLTGPLVRDAIQAVRVQVHIVCVPC